jgi:N-acetylmuramoyl-L-alanine amidase
MDHIPITSSTALTDSELNILNKYIIDEFIEKEIEGGFLGAALVIIRHGQILEQTFYGYKLKYDEHRTVIEGPQLLTLDTMFDLASLTKMYATNYALMQLVEQGKLNVDDPINKYIPEYSGCNPQNEYCETRLVKDLLTHTAGYVPTIELYDPEKVSPDLYSQDKFKTEETIKTKLGFA